MKKYILAGLMLFVSGVAIAAGVIILVKYYS